MYLSKCCMTWLCFVLLCILHTFSKGHIYFIIKNKKLKTLQQVRKTFQTYALSILAWKIRGLGYCSYLSQTGGKFGWSQGWFGPWLQQLAQPAISRDPFHTVGGNVIWSSHCGEQFGGSLKKKNRRIIWSSNPTPGNIPRQNSICVFEKIHEPQCS